MISYGSQSDALIRHLRDEREKGEERKRLQRFARRYWLMTDDYLDLVIQELNRVFTDTKQAERVALLGDVSLNVFKQIVEEIYRFTGAKRGFYEGDTPDPVYERIATELVDFDLLANEWSTAMGAYNDCLVRVLPAPLGADGQPRGLPSVRIFLPHEVSVVPRVDDPSQPEVVMYDELLRDGRVISVVWTDTEVHALGEKGERMLAPGTADFAHGFGRLPFVAIHRGQRPDDFWDRSSGEDLVQFTLQHNASWSSVRFLLHQQSYKQIVVTGADEQWPGFDSTGPGTILAVDTGMAVEALDMSADPRAQTETLYAMLAQKLASYGFNVEDFRQNPGQAPPSGLARYLSRQRILERRRRHMPFLVEAEHAFAETYRWAWNWNQPEKISESAKFTCEVIEETMVLSPMEQVDVRAKQLAVIKQERELGLRSPVEQIAEERGVSLEQAEEIAKGLRAKPEIFGYHIENGMVTRNQVLESLGFPRTDNPDDDLTLPELRAKYPERYGGEVSAPRETAPAAASAEE